MGWFSKKQAKEKETPNLPPFPKLPELPKLPGDEPDNADNFQGLPYTSDNYSEDGFSNDRIKGDISGRRENEDFGDFSNEPIDEPENNMQSNDNKGVNNIQQIQTLPSMLPSKEMAQDNPNPSAPASENKTPGENRTVLIQENNTVKEPIFVRIDKFKESLDGFRKIKTEVYKIDKMLNNAKEIRKQEQKEMESWDEQLKSVKDRLEEIGKDIFSKI